MEDGCRDWQSSAVRAFSFCFDCGLSLNPPLPVVSPPFFLNETHAIDRSIRSRHIPKPVYKAAQLKRTMEEAQRVKEERRRRHTRAGESKPKAERKKVVIAEQS